MSWTEQTAGTNSLINFSLRNESQILTSFEMRALRLAFPPNYGDTISKSSPHVSDLPLWSPESREKIVFCIDKHSPVLDLKVD